MSDPTGPQGQGGHGPADDNHAPVELDAIWRSLITEPTTGVSLFKIDEGAIVYLNEQAAHIYFGPNVDPKDVVGKPIDTLFPKEFIEERRRIARRVVEEDKPVLNRTMWRGWQMMTWLYPVHPEDHPEQPVDRLLAITRRIGSNATTWIEPSEDIEMIETNVIDLGELGVLSHRELVVLALLGQGLSVKEVASKVYRSEKTIQSQRDSISRKLHLRNRGELVRLVQQVGLAVEDAERLNVDPDEHDP